MLAGLIEAQNNPPIVRMRIGNEWKFVRMPIVVDTILLCRMTLCRRACYLSQKLADNPMHQCKFLIQQQMERILLSDALCPETDPAYSLPWDAYVLEMIDPNGATTKNANSFLSRKHDAVLHRWIDMVSHTSQRPGLARC
jgi:hypothetical protein